MKITTAHYHFLCSKKVSSRLFQHLKGMECLSIHRLIPQQDKRDQDFCIENTLQVLKSGLEQGESLRELLQELALSPGTLVNPRKRKTICQRWLDRLNGKRRKHSIPFICSWCEFHKLRVYQTSGGFYIGCSEPGADNCPDTTGVFPTREEAVSAAFDHLASFHYNAPRKRA